MSIKLYVSFGSGFYCPMNEFKPYSQPQLELPNPTQRKYLGQQTALSNLCAPALSWTISQLLWTTCLHWRKDHAHPESFAYNTDAFFWHCSSIDKPPLSLVGSVFSHQGLSKAPLTIIKLYNQGLQLQPPLSVGFFLQVCIWQHDFSLVYFFLTLLWSLAAAWGATLIWLSRVISVTFWHLLCSRNHSKPIF